jgi:hypothetical protein
MTELNTPITFYYAQLPHLLEFSMTLCEECCVQVKQHLSCGTRFKVSMLLYLPVNYVKGITQGNESGFYGPCHCKKSNNLKRYVVYGYSFKGKIIPERKIQGDIYIASVEFYLSNTVARKLKKILFTS